MWFVAWVIFETGTVICSGPMSRREALSTFHQSKEEREQTALLGNAQAVNGVYVEHMRSAVCERRYDPAEGEG